MINYFQSIRKDARRSKNLLLVCPFYKDSFGVSVMSLWLEGGEIRRVSLANKSHYLTSNSFSLPAVSSEVAFSFALERNNFFKQRKKR